MIHTAELSQDNIVESEFITESESYLIENGYKIDTAGYYLVVNHKQEDSNSGYIVKAVETTTVPFEQADVINDSYRLLLCSCAAYRYQQGLPDLDEHEVTAWEPCKHCKSVDPTIKAQADDSQSTL